MARAGPETRPRFPSADAAAPRCPPLVAVAMLSAAALAYEVLLMRLFSIVQWHHFAYMMISVALLGYGAAGTFVTLARPALLARYAQVFTAGAAMFGVSAVTGFLLAQDAGFDPLEMLWDPQQPLRLLAVYALLFVPFFCAATALCMTFTRFGEELGPRLQLRHSRRRRGSLGIIAALFTVSPTTALKLVGAAGLAAAAAGRPPVRNAAARARSRIAWRRRRVAVRAFPRTGRASIRPSSRP